MGAGTIRRDCEDGVVSSGLFGWSCEGRLTMMDGVVRCLRGLMEGAFFSSWML